jgi:hypothetical protein
VKNNKDTFIQLIKLLVAPVKGRTGLNTTTRRKMSAILQNERKSNLVGASVSPQAPNELQIQGVARNDQNMGRKTSMLNVSSFNNLGKMITFEEFCNRTSLHGWKYLGDATT